LNGVSGDTAVSGRASIEQQMPESMRGHGHRPSNGRKEYKEVSEFDIREDLTSWIVTDRAADGPLANRYGPSQVDPALLALQGM
jgi:hypothetical protein